MTKMELEMRLIGIEKMVLQLIEEIQNEEETEQEQIVEVTTKDVLKDLGANTRLQGYDYLVEEIMEKINNPKTKSYLKAAKKFGKDYSVIEHCIRTVKINILKNREKSELVQNIFKEQCESITNKEFITILADYIENLISLRTKIIGNLEKNHEDGKNAMHKNLVKKCLKEVGIIPGTKGYDYLTEEIIAKIELPYSKLYWNSAQKFSVSYYKVNTNIRNAKIKAFEKNPQTEFLKNLFRGYSKIPSNKEFISILADYVEKNISM